MTLSLLTGRLGRLALTALTIAAMAFLTRGLRTFVEAEALEAVEATSSAPSATRLVLEVADPPPVASTLGPAKRGGPRAVFSNGHRPGVCVPAMVKPVLPGPVLAI